MTSKEILGKVIASQFKAQERKPLFALSKHMETPVPPTPDVAAQVTPQPQAVPQDPEALGAKLASKYFEGNPIALSNEENRLIGLWAIARAKRRLAYEKVAGDKEGEAVSMDGSPKDSGGEHGEKVEPIPGGRLWPSGIDTVGDASRNSPNRTFDINDEEQGTASGVIDVKRPPKSPINKPLPGTGDAKVDTSKANSNATTYAEWIGDQSGDPTINDENLVDDLVLSDATEDVFGSGYDLALSFQRMWAKHPSLRGIFKDDSISTTPPIHEVPTLPKPGITVGGKNPHEEQPPSITPPPAALRHPGNIPLRGEEEPIAHDILLTHKALVRTAKRLQKRTK